MKLQGFKRLFKDNNEYGDYNYPYIDSLAYTVQEFLYTEGMADGDSFDCRMDSHIQLYDFMTIAVFFIGASTTELGKATIKDYIANLKQSKSDWDYQEDVEYSKNDVLVIRNASNKLVFSLLWAAWVYAMVHYKKCHGKIWERAQELLYIIMKEQYPYEEQYLKEHPLIARSSDAIKIMKEHMETKKSEENCSSMQDNERTDVRNLSISNQEQSTDSLIKNLEELKAENEKLKNQLAEALTIPNDITAKQKVRMELARLLMEKAGINDEILNRYGNKDKAGQLMGMLLDISAYTCKQYISVRELNRSFHKEAISKINPLLIELNTEIYL